MLWSSVPRGGIGVDLLRVLGVGTDHVVGVMAGFQHDLLDLVQIHAAAFLRQLFAQLQREVDDGLALVFEGVLLRVGLQDVAQRVHARRYQRDLIDGVLVVAAIEEAADDAVHPFIDRVRALEAVHGVMHRLGGNLGREARHEFLLRADVALAGLARGKWRCARQS